MINLKLTREELVKVVDGLETMTNIVPFSLSLEQSKYYMEVTNTLKKIKKTLKKEDSK